MKKAIGRSTDYLSAATERLRDEAAPDNDYTGTLILTPTAEAGRLLRENLARSGGAVGLTILLPDALFSPPVAAGENETLYNWLKTLSTLDRREESLLFRGGAVGRTAERLCPLALQLQNLRMTLARENLSFGSVIGKIDDEFSVGSEWFQRWQLLAELEARYLERFVRLPDPAAAMLEIVKKPMLPRATRRIVVACCMELPGAAAAALDNCAAETIEIWLGANEDELDRFDRFGRPLPAAWESCCIDFDLNAAVGCCSKPADQADKIIAVLEEQSAVRHCPAVIGILDPEVAGLFIDKSRRRANLPEFYLPGKRPLCELPFTGLFLQLLALAKPDPEFTAVAALARNAFVRRFLPETDWSAVAAALDKSQNRHLPLVLSQLRRTAEPECAGFVAAVDEWRRQLTAAKNLAESLWKLFSDIALASEKDEELTEFLFEFGPLKTIVAEAVDLSPPPPESAAMLKALLSRKAVSLPGNFAGRNEIAGILELNWRTEKHLLIAGFNEEAFNYPGIDDPFLPESLRKRLGLPCRENFFAADIVRFKALCQSKNLKLLYGKSGGSGEVLKPSRLLLQCSDAELPRRAAMLFSGGELAESRPQFSPEASKYPPYLPEKQLPGNNMDITGFKAYLKCPFQFYREKVLKCQELDDRALEMSPADFGNMIHEVMRRFGATPEVNNATDPAAIERFCLSELDRLIDRAFQRGRLGVVELQKELAIGSLKAFAVRQAELAAENWRPVATEIPAKINWADFCRAASGGDPGNSENAWREKLTVSGRIDRIDRLGNKNIWRVIDYKTAAKAADAKSAHLASSRSSAGFYRDAISWPAECEDRLATADGKLFWCDLQLPLYVLILRHAAPPGLAMPPDAPEVSAAYFNLPIDFRATGLSELPELNAELSLSALRCADAVMRRIFVERAFWPPKRFTGQLDSFIRYLGGVIQPEDFNPDFSAWRTR
ncbi:MAG: PD-(D/E)XK nuclease family protein [Victivallaceae bacterium]|nr:PD-(D/E)XK nuclease family protein [Victivallaceae bacterium]